MASTVHHPLHNERLGDLGIRVFELALEEKFRDSEDFPWMFNSREGEGIDCILTTPSTTAAYEIKFWIDASDYHTGYDDSKRLVLGRFESIPSSLTKNLVMIGKKPHDWKRIAWRCLRNRIIPFLVPLEEGILEKLRLEVDTERDFDPWIASAYYYRYLRNVLMMVLSTSTGEFRELDDYEWKFIEPIVAKSSRRGRPRASSRRVIDGILHVLSHQARFSDMPKEYGSYKTASRYFVRWTEDGIWERILDALGRCRGS